MSSFVGTNEISTVSPNGLSAYRAQRLGGRWETWEAQRDFTPQLDDFERLSFCLASGAFFFPLHQIVTLDEDLVDIMARDTPVKNSQREEERKEGRHG